MLDIIIIVWSREYEKLHQGMTIYSLMGLFILVVNMLGANY